MKITRFAQSCVLIETKGKRILVDPSYIEYEDSLPKKDWADIDLLLVTHKHSDHCHEDAIKEIVKNPKTKFYTTKEVADYRTALSPEIAKEGDVIKLDGIKVEVVKAVHGWLPPLKGKNEIHENVGYIVDDGTTRVYMTGDTICFDNDYKCDVLFVPVCNHGVVMDPFSAALFAIETGAKLIIPYHYESPKHLGDMKLVKKEFEAHKLNYKILKIKESIEV